MWTDNSQLNKEQISYLNDNDKAINIFSSKIKNLAEKPPNLFVYPKESGLENKRILEYDYQAEAKLRTTNIMGVISYKAQGEKPVTISIRSRFDNDEQQKFLLWMLTHTFGGNIVDLKTDVNELNFQNILLVFLFHYHLGCAYRQGLFKQYMRILYNDSNFRGALDVNRHIKQNFPFTGQIAYQIKEYSYDNPILWLIRHAAGYIRSTYPQLYNTVFTNNQVVGELLRIIKEATPSYTPLKQHHLYYKCQKPIRHPFYTEYENLRKICLQLLRHEGLNPYESSQEKEQVYGVLFDGAWLWESYIASLLKKHGFIRHIRGFGDENGIKVFNDGYRLYPDHHYKNENGDIIFDSKYKFWNTEKNSHDIHQVLAYMYITKAKTGGIIYPQKNDNKSDNQLSPKKLSGYNGNWWQIPFKIPDATTDNFEDEIDKNEKEFLNTIEKLV
ncbi:hypothetical protein QUF90_09305 [Desulfococcaceae bacterium HSG9]|nr:hypothetical protein [Desulfococcaceae bacterium HSG9]